MRKTPYDRISRFYDLLSGPAEGRLRRASVQLLEPHQGEAILDIGCGTGQGLRSLATGGAVGCGIDLSRGMLDVARRNLRRSGARNASLCRSDAHRMPFRTGAFDGALMSFTLELFPAPDMSVVLGECARILRPTGRLCVASLAQRDPAPLAQRLYQRLHDAFPFLFDCRPIDVMESLHKAGFTVQAAHHQSLFGLPVTIARAAPAVR
ncbi:MAG: methyltransferase domain-containing protein [Chitinivibrionales bacterium]|nr:methyltransferase domain-containing protein [Chitinivibrionales bacterium]